MLALHFVDIAPGDTRVVTDVLPILQELRPHLTPAEMSAIYDAGAKQGLQFLAAYRGHSCVGVAGWRVVINTSAGKKLYVDDLVTASAARSTGIGGAMLEELASRGRTLGCALLDLDSGISREDAHRFYIREGLVANAMHFMLPLS